MPITERILAALLAALGTVPGVQLLERNRTSSVPDGMTPALILFDGDMEGRTDRPEAVVRNRLVTFPMSIEPMVWGYVEGPDALVGERRSTLFGDVLKAVFASMPLRSLLAENDGGITVEGAAFPPPASGQDTAAAVFVLRLGLSFSLDPANP